LLVKRSALHRFGAVLAAACFLFGGAEHWLGFDPCPHHEGAFLFAAASLSEEAGHAGHHTHHGAIAEPSDSESDSGGHGPCDCVGPCASPAPPALPVGSSHATLATFERVEPFASRPRDVVPQQPVPFLLPYAHAPPELG